MDKGYTEGQMSMDLVHLDSLIKKSESQYNHRVNFDFGRRVGRLSVAAARERGAASQHEGAAPPLPARQTDADGARGRGKEESLLA